MNVMEEIFEIRRSCIEISANNIKVDTTENYYSLRRG